MFFVRKTLLYIVLALGDPLIKGLTEVANNRPTDPISFLANYLHGFARDKNMVSLSKALLWNNNNYNKYTLECK